ncbi:SusD family protein [Mucilaginibacter lappiensis]|uniref:Tetratricopeptide (TPR) repeat protein n=1 Tax=Mucilaginibacter lappiensis TaxID=354630 RepID=A0ABR6PG26_9SPHI|nr:RagB/SusD family nutrient uptake outer membrane protein [Mucilaginibacter lappiensis]MBB6108717.1 tetratricopeptide (TPR) repeat protein [Mucilaginibacter lappiensis]SIQ26706.1 SusD family protein [Mucilaginibacter lappiensis]
MKNYLIAIALMLYFSSCKKSFLDAKPNSSIVNPTSISEFQELLDNNYVLNSTGALPQMSCDDYFIVNQSSLDALDYPTYKGAYLWRKDLFGGETNIQDWNGDFNAIFYANSVLDGLNAISQSSANRIDYNNVKGEALFFRAYAYYDLVRNFCTVYNQKTATSDLGLPLRTSAGIDATLKRSNLQETFDLVISDLNTSLILLRDDFSTVNRNRPSRSAVNAMLARVYLYMGNYTEAANAADQCLAKYNRLIDYNTISTTKTTPFSYSTDETIFFSKQQVSYTYTTGYTTNWTTIGVDTTLLKSYSTNDLRLPIFFALNALNNYNVKRGYVGGGFYGFTGLATDEVMLIKAECAARANDAPTAMNTLNQLLLNRYRKGTFVPINTSNSTTALSQVLLERRKELVWRALRWSDLKRLNRDGANITLKRNLGEVTYTLTPNSSLYVFPIPDDEIVLSGIQQNIR